MKMLAIAVTVAGWVLLFAGAGLVVVGLAGVWLNDGFWAVAQTLSPFNVANFIATIAVLAPGLLLIVLGHKLRAHHRDRNRSD